MNVTARIIDVFMPTKLEDAAEKITALIASLLSRLLTEVQQYPFEDLTSVRQCREALKIWEENADIVYHEWRKSHRRHGHLSLRAETDWTELLGTLEQTTDSCYHTALLLERWPSTISDSRAGAAICSSRGVNLPRPASGRSDTHPKVSARAARRFHDLAYPY